ncbi:GNAT family N-acetyltransferase [Nocardioides sp. P5_C9_2]
MSDLEIRELDPSDDAAFVAWHRAYDVAERHALGDSAATWRLEELRAAMQDGGSHSWTGGWSGLVDGETVAAGWMRTPLLDNPELAEMTVHVLPAHRRRGHGTEMLAHLESCARERGRRVLTGLASWPYDAGSDGAGASGPAFAAARGWALALSEVQRELTIPVAAGVLDRLARDAAREHAAYTVRSWSGPVPDDLLTGWAEVTSSLATEAPTGDLDLEPEAVSPEAVREREGTIARQGRTKYNTVALDADGVVVAYTDLATTVHEPGRAYQWGTLVRRDHRGHRLGLAVKVANLRLLQGERPDVHRLTTYNAEVNAHMIAVNEALGFLPVARLGDFQKHLLPEVVRVGPDGWREFRDVRLASLADSPGAFGSRHADWVEATEERWRARLTDVPLTVVARSEAGAVGVVSGVPSPDGVELISMWVAPEHRGTGLAARLIDHVVGWATSSGRDTVLMVRDDNARAIRAYERCGFVDLGVPPDQSADQPPERLMRRTAVPRGAGSA